MQPWPKSPQFMWYVYRSNPNSNRVPHSWVSELTQQATAQVIGDPRYLRFNVLIREDAKG